MRTLGAIANEISRDWHPVHFAAQPYLAAMRQLELVTDDYGCDSGASIVAYFLANAGTWRGAVARRVKTELRRMIPQ